ATLTIADRYLSRESCSREDTNSDDSAEDGEPLTAPQDSQDDAAT
ncbi:transposase, partial [Halocatena pleomorpha]